MADESFLGLHSPQQEHIAVEQGECPLSIVEADSEPMTLSSLRRTPSRCPPGLSSPSSADMLLPVPPFPFGCGRPIPVTGISQTKSARVGSVPDDYLPRANGVVVFDVRKLGSVQPITLGTDFSGIETPSMALEYLGVATDLVFSCDVQCHLRAFVENIFCAEGNVRLGIRATIRAHRPLCCRASLREILCTGEA